MSRWPKVLPPALCAVVLLVFASRAQCRRWHDSISLWSHTLAVDPDAYAARVNLGAALLENGDARDAEALFREQLPRHPDDDLALADHALALGRR